MLTARFRMKGIAIFATATLALAMTATPTLASGGFYVPTPDKGALQQIKDLVKQGHASDLSNAALLTAMVSEGHAVWFTGGTPGAVREQVKKTMRLAYAQDAVPVLVAYNLPFRDCGQYSAGGALNTADYEAWIDGFAAGIGTGKAIVILEPDGLGIIPYNTPMFAPAMEWCQPDLTGTGLTPETANAARYEQLNYAVTRLGQQANVSVYLDATHSTWLGVGEAAYRLLTAGLARADGFFLNVSNYETTATNTIFGTWISECLARVAAWGGYLPQYCPSQYSPPAYKVDYSQAWIDSVNADFASDGATPRTHFVIDTSRNGLGPWTPPADKYSSGDDPQTWCNPPGRGVGDRPTANTGVPLIDAYLWVKVPGESDGSCTRSTGGTIDPEWGIVDPAAGQWFPRMALQLAQLANPSL